MDRFRTNIEIKPSPDPLSYHTPVMMLGSCFTENIGRYLQEYKYPVCLNPFGVLYNPVSILKSLEILTGKIQWNENNLVFHQGLWHSFYHHSSFSSPDKQECLNAVQLEAKNASAFLRKANFLFISWGTARAYIFRKTGEVVSNCHKIPAGEFDRFLLKPGEICSSYLELTRELKKLNPSLRLIFTVSPIRHWKDGAHQNQVSKSVLHLALQFLMEENSEISYFPSYELVMDELRDYRFYAEDMIHLSPQTVSYIWERFSDSYMNTEARTIMKRLDTIIRACRHVPFRKESNEYQGFLRQNLDILNKLKKEHPFLDLEKEETLLRDRMVNPGK